MSRSRKRYEEDYERTIDSYNDLRGKRAKRRKLGKKIVLNYEDEFHANDFPDEEAIAEERVYENEAA